MSITLIGNEKGTPETNSQKKCIRHLGKTHSTLEVIKQMQLIKINICFVYHDSKH